VAGGLGGEQWLSTELVVLYPVDEAWPVGALGAPGEVLEDVASQAVLPAAPTGAGGIPSAAGEPDAERRKERRKRRRP
jgi:hypothetical protein